MSRSQVLSVAAAVIVVSLTVATSLTARQMALNLNPFSPHRGHAYRHGVVPTLQAHRKMRQWLTSHQNVAALAPSSGNRTLSYGGAVDGIGVTSGSPRVYLVVYGSQWGTQSKGSGGTLTFSGDSKGEVPRLQDFFNGLGTGAEQWSGTMTQYCDGSSVAARATSCPNGAAHVAYPSGPVLAGIWYDSAAPSPASATGNQLAREAIAAAAHFGNTTAAANRYSQYFILSPSRTTPDGFNTANGNFCAWHDYNSDPDLSGGPVTSAYGDIAFTNFPYLTDNGAQCGAGYVNGNAGPLDGVTIVAGHEYAETITDQNPGGGWTNQTGDPTFNGQENGDECAWIDVGHPGGAANVKMGNGAYPMQSTWSNDTNQCEMTHAVFH